MCLDWLATAAIIATLGILWLAVKLAAFVDAMWFIANATRDHDQAD